MKKLFILSFTLLLLFVFGCANPIVVYNTIEEKYPNSRIIKLQGDGDQYIVYTENREIRFINVSRAFGTFIEIDQKIDLIMKK